MTWETTAKMKAKWGQIPSAKETQKRKMNRKTHIERNNKAA